MKTTDAVTRLICDELDLRFYTVTALDTVKAITSLHGTTPNATVPLGRTIIAAALLSATLKIESNQSISLKFSGSGPLAEIQVQVDALGNVRGYVANPAVDAGGDFDRIDFSKAIGAGLLTVTRDLGLREPYRSVSPLLAGDIAADLAYFLTMSEQIPSALILGLTLDAEGMPSSAGGILVQTFPDTKPEAIESVEAHIRSLTPPLGDSLRDGADIVALCEGLVAPASLAITGSTNLRAACRCSREVLSDVLRTISRKEIEEMIAHDRGSELTCSFCRTVYRFTAEELQTIIDTPAPLH